MMVTNSHSQGHLIRSNKDKCSRNIVERKGDSAEDGRTILQV